MPSERRYAITECAMGGSVMPPADKAVLHILTQMQYSGRLAYLLGPGTRSFELLTEAYADRFELSVEDYRKEFVKTLAPSEAR